MNPEIPKKFLDIIVELDHGFWSQWYEKTLDFPDTEDAAWLRFTVMESAINTIIINYIMGFPKEKRSYYLETLILQLRTLELKIRDLEDKDVYE